MAWAQASGRCLHASQFAARLEGRQVSAELYEQFQQSPEFGRSLTERIEPYHDNDSLGDLTLIDAGGEAVVFFEPEAQRVIKLFAPPNSGRYGYVLDQATNGRWQIRGGDLIEALYRFVWFEACFGSGLELDAVGTEADFLTLSQPFYVGRRPCEDELEEWMLACGWEPWSPPTDQATVATHSWRRGDYAASDVVPRNAIIAEGDGRMRAIDFGRFAISSGRKQLLSWSTSQPVRQLSPSLEAPRPNSFPLETPSASRHHGASMGKLFLPQCLRFECHSG